MKRAEYRLFLSGVILIIMVLATTDVWAERMAVIGNTANVRSGPGTDYASVWQVEKYHPIDIVKVSGNWYQFKDFENDIGWIHKSLVKKISTVITKKAKCNVREGPDTKYDILFTVDSGVPFKVEKRQGKWIQIRHADGDTGWIHQSLIW